MKQRVLLLFLLLALAGVSRLHATSFFEWQWAQFSQAELLDPAVSGEDANPAGDGLSNWLKYVFDLDPHAACIEGAPAPQMVGGTLALNFFRRTDYPYLIYALEASPDLRHWSWRNSYQPSAVTSLGAVAQWTVADPYQWPAGSSQFLRLRVEPGVPGSPYYLPPADLTARTMSVPFGLELRWSDRSNAELGYRVERQRIADGVWDLFAITGQDTFSYFDHTVQSGVAYAYRVCAMFPGGWSSGWTESGDVTPGGGGPGGPGGPGGGAPDPAPDTDSDTFKDSVDAYPHDKRRSRDLPTLTYAEIDISTAIIGAKDVTMIALDDQNQVAFSYGEAASGDTPGSLKVVLWKDGAQVGDTLTYPLSAAASGDTPPDWSLYPGFLNASGTIAGTAIQSQPVTPATNPVSYKTKSCGFTQSAGGQPAFLHGSWGDWAYGGVSVGGLTSTGIIWGQQTKSGLIRSTDPEGGNFDFIGGAKFPFLHDPAHPPNQDGPDDPGTDLGPKFEPYLVNKDQHAVGTQFEQTSLYRYAGGESAALPAKTARALSDDGTIFGVASGTPPDPGQPADSLNPYFWTVTAGTPTNVSPLLPIQFRKQISFNESTGGQMNSEGDLLFSTATLEGPEDDPAWNPKPILWTRQTSTANPNGTLAIVTNPGSSLNKDRLMVDMVWKYPINATTGEEDTSLPAYRAAVLKVPVEVTVDADRNGQIELGKDTTTAEKPYEFWVNHDRDIGHTQDGDDWEEDDVQGNETPETWDIFEPGLEWRRDLEDVARVWIDLSGFGSTLNTHDANIKLYARIEPTEGSPEVTLFQAVETDGGRMYLTDNDTGYNQTQSYYGEELCTAVNTPQGSEVPRRAWEDLPADKVIHLLFEGRMPGKGKLIFEFRKGGQLYAIMPPAFLNLKNVEDMYETWTVGDVTDQGEHYNIWPATSATKTTGQNLPTPKTSREKDYILSVHGWNMSPFDKDAFAATAFKRLWHQGYMGRFGAFRWPTFWFAAPVPNTDNFNGSEERAWNSGAPLAGLVSQLGQTFQEGGQGKVRLYAHSMGNIVASECLRHAAPTSKVHTYIAAQAALSSHVWDNTTPLMPFTVGGSPSGGGPDTPDVYGYYWETGATSQPHEWQGEGRPSYMDPRYMPSGVRYINHYNPYDWALSFGRWQVNQMLKPSVGYNYSIMNPFDLTDLNKRFWKAQTTKLVYPDDRFQIFSFAAESHAYATGQQGSTGGMFGATVDLNASPFSFGSAHKGHSAQYRSSIQKRWLYWKRVIDDMRITAP